MVGYLVGEGVGGMMRGGEVVGGIDAGTVVGLEVVGETGGNAGEYGGDEDVGVAGVTG